jgi:penicillin-insensitive murein endopeptidase
MRMWRRIALVVLVGCGAPAAAPVLEPTQVELPAEATQLEAPEPSQVEVDAGVDAAPEVPDTGPTADEVSDTGPAEIVALADATPSTSTSVGGPNEGSLLGGIPLPRRAPGLLRNPHSANADAYFGTYELVRSLVDAAAIVHRELPGGTVTINDIGFREGGTIPHHGSHRAGRDVDVLFFMLDPDGQPRAGRAVPIDLEGQGTDYADLVDPSDDVPMQIDIARTWRLVQALVTDDDAIVQRIFVVEHIRTMLLAEADRVHAPRAAIRRFAEVSCQPGYPHDDHLHVRYFCTAEDIAGGCEDAPPIYPWRRDQLAELGLEPVIAHPRRRSRETAATSPPAGTPMDAAVTEFLARRETWAHQPHPGRPYCR